ncbi:MAG: glycosyltransferase family 2 protein [Candidatus Actinomarina sp.]
MSGKFNVKNFSVVVPVFNEEDILLQSAAQIYDICKRKGLDFELIFVENGSEDKTLSLLKTFVSKKEECRLVILELANYGNALKHGFLNAENQIVISFDIDYFSEDFLEDALKLNKKYAAITASKRLVKSDDGRRFIRRLATFIFVTILKLLFKTKLSDTHGMKAVRKASIVNQIDNVVSTQDLFDTELLIRVEKSGNKILEVPAVINEIRPSVSVIYKRIPRTISSLIKLRVQLSRESLKTKNL